jgi:hypothetical protein
VRRGVLIRLIVLVALLVGAVTFVTLRRDHARVPGASIAAIIPGLATTEAVVRDQQPYAGYGAWVDGFDFGTGYQKGGRPPVTATVIDDLAAHGVKTLYLQAVRDDTRSPEGYVDGATIADILIRAHRAGMQVVGWYLPRFRDVDKELADIEKMASFKVLGHQLDGIAIDIEYTDDEPDVDVRNQRLVELSRRLRARSGKESIGAIVLPPVQTEVINQRYWPDFPWTEIRSLYDVWMPMSYWTFRTGDYADGYSYNEESTRRLRNNLGQPNAVVHAIGGIGDKATSEQLDGFARSLVETKAVGGSIYDWNSMTPALRDSVSHLFRGDGAAAALPVPVR